MENYLKHRNKNFEQYKEHNNVLKKLVKAAKKKTLEKFGKKLEEDYNSNQKLFYMVLKTFETNNRQQQTTTQIKDQQGMILTERNLVVER